MVLHVVLFLGIWLESSRAEIMGSFVTEGMILVMYMFSPHLFDILCAAICKNNF